MTSELILMVRHNVVPQDGEDISGDTVSISFTTNYGTCRIIHDAGKMAARVARNVDVFSAAVTAPSDASFGLSEQKERQEEEKEERKKRMKLKAKVENQPTTATPVELSVCNTKGSNYRFSFAKNKVTFVKIQTIL